MVVYGLCIHFMKVSTCFILPRVSKKNKLSWKYRLKYKLFVCKQSPDKCGAHESGSWNQFRYSHLCIWSYETFNNPIDIYELTDSLYYSALYWFRPDTFKNFLHKSHWWFPVCSIKNVKLGCLLHHSLSFCSKSIWVWSFFNRSLKHS